MKTSIAYRKFRLYYNANQDNHELFGSRVFNPVNASIVQKSESEQGSLVRLSIIGGALVSIVLISLL